MASSSEFDTVIELAIRNEAQHFMWNIYHIELVARPFQGLLQSLQVCRPAINTRVR